MTIVPSRRDHGLAVWDAEQLDVLKRDLGIKNDAHLAYFAQVCTHKDLDPFLDEIVPIYYGDDMVIQETVQGLRTIAERSGLYGGYQGPWWCDQPHIDCEHCGRSEPIQWLDLWFDEKRPPAGARFLVIRKDWTELAEGKVRWASCVQLNQYGKPRGLWKTRPDEMLAKTAEARALKRAFSKEFARAGVNVRDLTDEQIVAAEGRRIGLSDEDRHALVAEITDGRTGSSTDLSDAERLAARAEIARRRRAVKATAAGPGGTETYWYDPETGERVDPPSEEPDGAGEVTQDAADTVPRPEAQSTANAQPPAPDDPGYVDPAGRIHVPDDAELERRRLVAELVPRARALDADGRSLLHTWLDSAGIGSAKKVKDYTLDELRRTADAIAEFERPLDEEPF